MPGKILLVGINPSPVSVAAGHYYQGTLGRRLWARLADIGLLRDAEPGNEDDAFCRAGHGLTDLVKKPTSRATSLARDEIAAGIGPLRRKVRDWKPGLMLFAFRPPAEAIMNDQSIAPGPCGAFESIPGFLLTGPYASRVDRVANDRALLSALRRLA
jgi:TDG/mug DNA glycosylase family protein